MTAFLKIINIAYAIIKIIPEVYNFIKGIIKKYKIKKTNEAETPEEFEDAAS